MNYCYIFKDGPFKGAYIRINYDPRNDVQSIRSQVFHFMIDHPTIKDSKITTKVCQSVMLADCKNDQIMTDLNNFLTNSKKQLKFSVG